MSIFRNALDKRNRDEKGFTLIELLVVIIIIGILAAIAIPIFLNQRKKAVDAGSKSDARTIATQLETYYTDLQTYPTDLEFAYAAGTPSTIDIGSAADIAGGTAEKVVLSSGNIPVVKLNAASTAFCVTVSNPKGTKVFVWESNAGGLQPTAVACNPLFTVTLA